MHRPCKKHIAKHVGLCLLVSIIVSIIIAPGVYASPIYKLNNTFYDPNYATNPGVLEELIYPWEHKRSDSTTNSYVSPSALILAPNEGIQYHYQVANFPYEFNYTIRTYFLSWPDTDSDGSPMWEICTQEWNTGSAGYLVSYFQLNDKLDNGTYRFGYNSGSSLLWIYIPNGQNYVYTLTVHTLFNTTSKTGINDYSLCYEQSTENPGDETYINITGCPWRYNINGYDYVYLRVGGYSAGSYSTPGYTWVKYIKLWWDDGVSPESTPPASMSVSISNIVKEIVFFIPILVLCSLFGRIGFVGGVGLMTIIWIFANADFVPAGILILISLGIFVYRGV